MEPPMPRTAGPALPLVGADTTTPDEIHENNDPTKTHQRNETNETNDPDAGVLGEARAHRPVHLHPGFVLVVIGGGVIGALARYGLSILVPVPAGWPLPTLITNLTGAFLLGALLEALVRSGPDTGGRRLIRLLAGTGFLGAFTTYSALALEANTLLGVGRPMDALLYVAATLLGGTIATVVGIGAATGYHARRTARRRNADLRADRQDGGQ